MILIEEANQAINKGKFEVVSRKYLKVAELCNKIGDIDAATSYNKAAEEFKQRALENEQREKELRESINRAINAAKIAYKNREYSKISDLYYNVASMLHELGDEQNAIKFSNSAKKFRERVILEQKAIEVRKQLPKEVQESIKHSPISQVKLSTIKPQQTVSQVVRTPQAPRKGIPTPKSNVPSHLSPSALGSMKINIDKLDKFMESLGIRCPSCGEIIKDPKITKCPKCGKAL